MNIFSRIFEREGFSYENSFADFLSKILNLFFFFKYEKRKSAKEGFSFEYSCTNFLSKYPCLFSPKGDFRSNILCGFSFEYSPADFLSNTLLRIFFRIFFHGFSFKYSFTDWLSNMVMRDHMKKISWRGFFLTELFPRALLKVMKAFNTFVYFLPKEIFAQIFSVDFLLNILPRIFFQILFSSLSLSLVLWNYPDLHNFQTTILTALIKRFHLTSLNSSLFL